MTRALVAQTFVVIMMVTGLTIALIRLHVNETMLLLAESEEALALRADELDSVLSHLKDGVAIVEETGKVVRANAALHSVLDDQAFENQDRQSELNIWAKELYFPGGGLVTPKDRPFARAFSGEPVDAEEFERRAADGSTRVLEISAFKIPGPRDAPGRVQEVIRDVTAAAAQRESLVWFAGAVAHDLKNPLTVIEGWAEIAEERLCLSTSPGGG